MRRFKLYLAEEVRGERWRIKSSFLLFQTIRFGLSTGAQSGTKQAVCSFKAINSCCVHWTSENRTAVEFCSWLQILYGRKRLIKKRVDRAAVGENDKFQSPSCCLFVCCLQDADVSPAQRDEAVRWLTELHGDLRLYPETLVLAVSILDRFLAPIKVLRNKSLE